MSMPSPTRSSDHHVDIAWTLGERIAKVRRVFRMDQAEFADLFGVTDKAVSKWETDASKPRDLLGFAYRLQELAAERDLWIPAVWILHGDAGFPLRAEWNVIDGEGLDAAQGVLPFRAQLQVV